MVREVQWLVDEGLDEGVEEGMEEGMEEANREGQLRKPMEEGLEVLMMEHLPLVLYVIGEN